MLFDNPVDKVQRFLDVMYENNITPECECFDTGIVRSVAMFKKAGLLKDPVHVAGDGCRIWNACKGELVAALARRDSGEFKMASHRHWASRGLQDVHRRTAGWVATYAPVLRIRSTCPMESAHVVTVS